MMLLFLFVFWLNSKNDLLVKKLTKENEVLEKQNIKLSEDICRFEEENFKLTQMLTKNNFRILNNFESSLDKLFDINFDLDSSDKNKKGKVKK